MVDENLIKKKLEENQFVRYVLYLDILEFIQKQFHSKQCEDIKVVEFGGSNETIKDMFNFENYEIAENFPVVDIQNLKDYKSDSYDYVILDQVLEHVSDPWKAIREIYRIIKENGYLIITTPFLIQLHFGPRDYWRFTNDGLKEILCDFSEVEIKSWGNKGTAIFHLEAGTWPSTKQIREMGLFDISNDPTYPYVYWGFAKK